MKNRHSYVLLFVIVMCTQMVIATDNFDLKRFKSKGKYGFKDSNGTVVIEPQFDLVKMPTSCGIVAVYQSKSGWRYINRKGETVAIPFHMDTGSDFFIEGVARFEKNGKFGFFDECGKVVIEPDFEMVQPFTIEGFSLVCAECYPVKKGEKTEMRGGKWGCINKRGGFIVPLEYSDERLSDLWATCKDKIISPKEGSAQPAAAPDASRR